MPFKGHIREKNDMEGPPSFILKILTKCQDHNEFTHGTYMYELHVLCNSQIYTSIHLKTLSSLRFLDITATAGYTTLVARFLVRFLGVHGTQNGTTL